MVKWTSRSVIKKIASSSIMELGFDFIITLYVSIKVKELQALFSCENTN